MHPLRLWVLGGVAQGRTRALCGARFNIAPMGLRLQLKRVVVEAMVLQSLLQTGSLVLRPRREGEDSGRSPGGGTRGRAVAMLPQERWFQPGLSQERWMPGAWRPRAKGSISPGYQSGCQCRAGHQSVKRQTTGVAGQQRRRRATAAPGNSGWIHQRRSRATAAAGQQRRQQPPATRAPAARALGNSGAAATAAASAAAHIARFGCPIGTLRPPPPPGIFFRFSLKQC